MEEDEEDLGQAEVVEERLLDGVPLEVQEAFVCEDLLFILQVSAGCVVDRALREGSRDWEIREGCRRGRNELIVRALRVD